MQPEQVKTLIEDAIRNGLSYQWWVLIVAIVASAIIGYFSAYLARKAEGRAAREDFSTILGQLRETTRETEEIKQLLSGRAWRIQRQWEARARYYGELLTHLHGFRLALSGLANYYIEPGSEYTPDDQQGEGFHKLSTDASASLLEVKKLVGSAALFLSEKTVKSLDELIIDHWNLANFGSICTADYVDRAYKLVCSAFDAVLSEARFHLGLVNDAS